MEIRRDLIELEVSSIFSLAAPSSNVKSTQRAGAQSSTGQRGGQAGPARVTFTKFKTPVPVATATSLPGSPQDGRKRRGRRRGGERGGIPIRECNIRASGRGHG